MAGTPILVGTRFGKWTVTGKAVQGRYPVTCDCGRTGLLNRNPLENGRSKGCGKAGCRDRTPVHGGAKGKPQKLYGVWKAMRHRCEMPRHKAYASYGARGILVCKEWTDFGAFQAWALSTGYQEGLSIDRIDNDGNYEPNNCRWATMAVQDRNKRSNRQLTAFGETKLICEWIVDERCVVSQGGLLWRLNHDWPPEEAITKKPGAKT